MQLGRSGDQAGVRSDEHYLAWLTWRDGGGPVNPIVRIRDGGGLEAAARYGAGDQGLDGRDRRATHVGQGYRNGAFSRRGEPDPHCRLADWACRDTPVHENGRPFQPSASRTASAPVCRHASSSAGCSP